MEDHTLVKSFVKTPIFFSGYGSNNLESAIFFCFGMPPLFRRSFGPISGPLLVQIKNRVKRFAGFFGAKNLGPELIQVSG